MDELQSEIYATFNAIRRHLNQGFNDDNLLEYMERANQCTDFDQIELVWAEFCAEVGNGLIV